MKISEKYRSKALAREKFGREATDYDIKCAWEATRIANFKLADPTVSWRVAINTGLSSQHR
jgi:hypothetical protein